MLGGTFDPVHVGHVAAAAEVRHALGPRPGAPRGRRRPLAEARPGRGARPRIAWRSSRRRSPRIEGVEASAIEVERDGASVTADTLEALARPGSGAVPHPRRRCRRQHGDLAAPRRDPARSPTSWWSSGPATSTSAARSRVAGRPRVDPPPRHLVDRPAGPPGARPPGRRPRAARRRGGDHVDEGSTLAGDDDRVPRLTEHRPGRACTRPWSRPKPRRRRTAPTSSSSRSASHRDHRASSCSSSATQRASGARRSSTRSSTAMTEPTAASPIAVEGLGDAVVGPARLRRRRRARVPRRDPRPTTTSTASGPTCRTVDVPTST